MPQKEKAMDRRLVTVSKFLAKHLRHAPEALAAVFFSADWKRLADVPYYNLTGWDSCHSDDITSAPMDAAEFKAVRQVRHHLPFIAEKRAALGGQP
jgi:hypothetical protein